MSFLVFCPNCYLFLYLVTLLFSFAECFFSVVELGSRRPLLSLFFFFSQGCSFPYCSSYLFCFGVPFSLIINSIVTCNQKTKTVKC